DAVGRDHAHAARGGLLQAALQLGHIGVAIAEAPGLAQADTVDDAGVVQLVAEDGVLFAQEGFEQAAVGVEAGGVEDGIFLAQEVGDGLLELLVDVLRAADKPHGRQAVAIAPEAVMGGLNNRGMTGQAEIVIGAEVDDLASGHADGRALRSLQLPLTLVKAAALQLCQLPLEHVDQLPIGHGMSPRGLARWRVTRSLYAAGDCGATGKAHRPRLKTLEADTDGLES